MFKRYLLRILLLTVIITASFLLIIGFNPDSDQQLVLPTLMPFPDEIAIDIPANEEDVSSSISAVDVETTIFATPVPSIASADSGQTSNGVANTNNADDVETTNNVSDASPEPVIVAPPIPSPISINALQPSQPVNQTVPTEAVVGQIVIRFTSSASAQDRADYIASIGGTIEQTVDALNSVVITIPDQVVELPPSELVVESEPDYYVSALVDIANPPSDPYYSEQWALPVIAAPEAWAELPDDAPQVTVAVIDSGVCLDHPDLEGRILAGYDFVENDAIAQDELGHGCGVAGIIAANIDNGIGIAGVAPNAMIMSVRVLDASGIGTYSDVAAGIVYAVDNGAEIINLSLGGGNHSTLLEAAVNYAVEQGVTVVAAAGNTGGAVLYPAKYEPVIAVGALDQDLQPSSFSANGAEVDVWAPGRDILMTGLNGSYVTSNGTSFAAPFISGIADIRNEINEHQIVPTSQDHPFEGQDVPGGMFEDIYIDMTYEQLDTMRQVITHPGALTMNVHLTNVNLMPDDIITITNPEGTQYYTYPFDDIIVIGEGDDGVTSFWLVPIFGDTIIVEIHRSNTTNNLNIEDFGITIDRFIRGVDPYGVSAQSGSCNIDVICAQADMWRNQVDSVVAYSLGGTPFCTGALINNTAENEAPYILTANHCEIDADNASQLVVFFNFENSTCRTPGSSESGEDGDGVLTQVSTGAILRASYAPSDMTLLELESPVPEQFGVYFSGWNRSSSIQSNVIAIHHPSGDEKRISFENDPTMITSYLSNSVGDATHIRVVDWDAGTTEGGSSGSPLFDSNGLIVGQLHGGTAACGNDNSDWYGRLFMSWTGGGTSDTRLSDWLDPLGTNNLTLDGIRDFELIDTLPKFVGVIERANTINEIVYIELPSNFTFVFNDPNNGSEASDGANALPVLTGNLIINGNNATISRGTSNMRLFQVAPEGSLTLNDVSFNRWDTAGDGGVIHNQGNLTLENTNFTLNSSQGSGGAIYNEGFLNVNNLTFNENTSVQPGGAIFNEMRLNVDNTLFQLNSSDANGGAIANYSNNSGFYSLTVTNSRFIGNESDSAGGAIHSSDDVAVSVLIDNTEFDENTASLGGAVSSQDASTSISDSIFTNNIATSGNGSAFYHIDLGGNRYQNLHSSIIVGNNGIAVFNADTDVSVDARWNWWGSADGPSGEGIGTGDAVGELVLFEPYLDENPENTEEVTCSTTTVPENDIVCLISAINFANSNPDVSTITLENGFYEFTDINNITDGANALPVITTSIIIEGNGAILFRSNTASVFRFFQISAGALTLENMQLRRGSATVAVGGGAILNQGANLVVDNVTFLGNSSIGGGAIRNQGGVITILSSNFIGNFAPNYGAGGAIDNRLDAQVIIRDSFFEGNSAENIGGVLYNNNSDISIYNTIFDANSALNFGGALFIFSGSVIIEGSVFNDNYVTASSFSSSQGGAIRTQPDTTMTISNSTFTINRSVVDGGALSNLGELSVNNSCFVGNRVIGFLADGTDVQNESLNVLNANDNWWGDPSGPSGEGNGSSSADSVGINIDFSNYLASDPGCPVLDILFIRNLEAGSFTNFELEVGVEYIINVDGTLSIWHPDIWSTNGGCTQTEPFELVPRYPSSINSGFVGIDPEYIFAAPNNTQECSEGDRPYQHQNLEFSLDAGNTWTHYDPISTDYNESHRYSYHVIGQGQTLGVRFQDSNHFDNYGTFRVSIVESDSSIARGDCNADTFIDAGDLSAIQLEIFDGDSSSIFDDLSSGFAGNPIGCDANADTVIDAGDLSCTQRIIFDEEFVCGASP